jgi:hypothetical protein
MKKLIVLLGLFILPLRLFAPSDWIVPLMMLQKQQMEKYSTDQLNAYLDSLAIPESGKPSKYPLKIKGIVYKSPYRIINYSTNAAGKWQLTPIARKEIRYKGTLQQFLNSPKLQKKCTIDLMKRIKIYIKYYIPNYQDYIGKIVNGVLITYSGMFGAAHIGGVGALKAFLTHGYNASDGNHSVKSYMQLFGGFNFGLLV